MRPRSAPVSSSNKSSIDPLSTRVSQPSCVRSGGLSHVHDCSFRCRQEAAAKKLEAKRLAEQEEAELASVRHPACQHSFPLTAHWSTRTAICLNTSQTAR